MGEKRGEFFSPKNCDERKKKRPKCEASLPEGSNVPDWERREEKGTKRNSVRGRDRKRAKEIYAV